ncbi:DUF6122 family protein [Lacinutrix sp. Bg11-31]|uniref:DUF6122 family protein n=1 Tax=Lacinutrix sp. Bg11-31 TaxID=2057808 RepID=UPI000C318B58|nr:DUF6122 family protein [Lacinutrix sp. Bg11-31]AUC80879.1 hypothetical protein CW733_01500 [Lacinutrix sp. Bg11-31]
MMQPFLHYGIHFLLPLAIALYFFKSQWKKAYLIMILGILIDLDHLLANPIFEANRCSINFHPLHSYYLIPFYLLLVFPKKTRWIGLGLCIHILADAVDCWMMS